MISLSGLVINPIHLWFWLALLGAVFSAIVHLIDVYLLKDDVFMSPIEPAIISGFMQSMLWLVLPFVNFSLPTEAWISCLAVLGGTLYIWSLYFYFKALFTFGDVSTISLLWNLVLAVVPIFAYLFLGERLSVSEYAGAALLFAGAMSISLSRSIGVRDFFGVFSLMSVAVLGMSISAVCLKGVYMRVAFWDGYVLYNLGVVGGAALLYIFFMDRQVAQRFHHKVRRYFWLFFFIETLQLVGDTLFNIAENIGPVSLVVAIESMQAIFVMLLGMSVVLIVRFLFKRKQTIVLSVHALQSRALFLKICATIIMAWGAYMVS